MGVWTLGVIYFIIICTLLVMFRQWTSRSWLGTASDAAKMLALRLCPALPGTSWSVQSSDPLEVQSQFSDWDNVLLGCLKMYGDSRNVLQHQTQLGI